MRALYLIGSYVFAATLIFGNSSNLQAGDNNAKNLRAQGDCTDCPAATQEMQQNRMQQSQLEDWMTNDSFWTLETRAPQTAYASEQEEGLEEWMVEDNFLGFFEERKELDKGLEAWMLDDDFWQISSASYVDTPVDRIYLPLEQWMIDPGFWTL